MARTGRALLPCLLLAALAVLAGCAAPGVPETPDNGIGRYYDVRQLLVAVAGRTRADRSAALSMHGTLVGPTPLTFTGDGAVRLDPAGVALRLDQVVEWPGAARQQTAMLVVGRDAYVLAGHGGRPWLRAGAATAATDRVRAALAVSLGDAVDPTVNLARYADATLVADASDDTVDGVPVVRYTLVVDLGRAALEQSDPALRAQLEDQSRTGLTRITSTLWVDDAHRPLRTEQRQDLPGMGTLTVTGDYRRWGEPVQIDPPPPAEVR